MTRKEKAGGVDVVAIHLPTKPHTHCPAPSGVFSAFESVLASSQVILYWLAPFQIMDKITLKNLSDAEVDSRQEHRCGSSSTNAAASAPVIGNGLDGKKVNLSKMKAMNGATQRMSAG